MIKQFKYKNITWIDVTSPSKKEVESLAKDYNLHPVAAAELLEPSQRPKVDLFDEFIYLVLDFPTCKELSDGPDREDKNTNEVDFIIGKDFLITASYSELHPIQEFAKIFEANSLFNKNRNEAEPGYLFYYIIRHLYVSFTSRLEAINFNLRTIEKNIFSGRQKEMVGVLADINKKLIDFRWSLKPHREVLHHLELIGTQFFNHDFSYNLKSIITEYDRVVGLLESDYELFYDLRNTNDSLLTIESNETMKILTLLALVTFPLSLLVAILDMDTSSNPISNLTNGFWVVLGVVAILTVSIFSFYKYKRWL